MLTSESAPINEHSPIVVISAMNYQQNSVNDYS